MLHRKFSTFFCAIGLVALALRCSPISVEKTDSGAAGGDAGRDAGKDSGVTDGGSGGGGGLDINNACSALSNARCQYYLKCGLIEPTQAAIQNCVSYFAATWCGQYRWSLFVKAGTLAYDGLAAQRCADAWAARGLDKCIDWESLPTDCGKILSPNLIAGQKCY